MVFVMVTMSLNVLMLLNVKLLEHAILLLENVPIQFISLIFLVMMVILVLKLINVIMDIVKVPM